MIFLTQNKLKNILTLTKNIFLKTLTGREILTNIKIFNSNLFFYFLILSINFFTVNINVAAQENQIENVIDNRMLAITDSTNTIINTNIKIIDSTVTDDTLGINDNIKINDTLKTNNSKDSINNNSKDSIKFFSINKFHGSILEHSQIIHFYEVPTLNYFSLNDIFIEKIQVYPLNTGIAGNFNTFSTYGANSSENKLLINNIPIVDLYGNSNFSICSPEFSNQFEILQGSKSVIITGNSGTTVNIQTSLFNTAQPYSRIWYNQGDNKHIGVDGIYSQNFLPNWNFTAGFQTMFSNGYFENSSVKSWNLRAMLRKNLSDLSSISLLYHFSNYYSGDFGGINFANFNTNNNQANLVNSNFSSLANRQYRTDLVFTHSTVTNDSSLIVNSNIFLNHNENNILFQRQKELLQFDSTGKNITNDFNAGIHSNAKYQLFHCFRINAGIEISYSNYTETIISKEFKGINYNLYGLGTIQKNIFEISGGCRFENKFTKQLFSLGGNITANIDEYSIFTDISYNNSAPSLIFDFRNEKHFLGIIGAKTKPNNIKSHNWNIETNIFFRQITDPIILKFDQNNLYTFTPMLENANQFENLNKKNIYGLLANITFTVFQNFECSAKIQNYYDEQIKLKNGNIKPKFLITGAMQYNYSKGTSKISGGFTGTILFNDNPLYYNPIFKTYSMADIENDFGFNGLSIFFKAKLGNAFVRATMYNVIGTNFSYLAYYPILKREVCLSLTWAFPNEVKK